MIKSNQENESPEEATDTSPAAGRHAPHSERPLLHRRLTPVRRSDYRMGKAWVTCYLYEVRVRGDVEAVSYAIGMRGLGQRCLCHAGSDEAFATKAYGLIVRNSVTPCTLRDVLTDLREEAGAALCVPTRV